MRLQRIAIYRLTRILAGLLPAGVVVLIAVAGWDYWTRSRISGPEAASLPADFSDDLAVRGSVFEFTRSEGGKPLFRIKAKVTLKYINDKQVGQDVDVEIYPKNASDPIRHIHGDECSYDEKSEEIFCKNNVRLQLDANTVSRTEEVRYSAASHLIFSDVRTHIEQPGQMTGDAGHLKYFMDSGLLSLSGNVRMDHAQGGSLRGGNALFQQKENWATVTDGVELQSANGSIRGSSARADLQPGTYRPTRITVDNAVSAESHARNVPNAWSLRSNWLQSDLSPEGNIQHVLARGAAEVERNTATGDETLKGNEIEAHMDAAGAVTNIEARQNPEFQSGDRRLTAETTIVIDPKGTVTTAGASVLKAGTTTEITGRNFTIQQDERVRRFTTPHRAVLVSGERRTEGNLTSVDFDVKSNQLRELTQTGSVKFTEGARTGTGEKVRMLNDGKTIILEAPVRASVTDKNTALVAPTITMNQDDKSVEGSGGVVMTDSSKGDQPVRVTATRTKAGEQTVEYWGSVHFTRGDAMIKGEHLVAYTKENRFRADGHVSSRIGDFDTTSDEMDYFESSDKTQTARYKVNVRAQRIDKDRLILETSDMTVNLKDGMVQNIEAKGAVDITQGPRHGHGVEAVYDAKTGAIVLSGSDTVDATLDGPEGNTRGYLIRTSGDGRVASVQPSRINGGVSTSINKTKK